MGWALSIDRGDIASAQVVDAEPQALKDGEVRLAIRRFALTSNNITYAAFGDVMGYWKFFSGTDGTGRLPVWGFAEVAETRVDDLPVGERIYGYFPAASELVVQPERISEGAFVDASAHRQDLPAAYNRYMRVAGDPGYDEALEAEQMVLQPLFITSFLLDLFLRDTGFFETDGLSLTSASSKTAISLAWLLARDKPAGLQVEALTSPGNVGFVKSLNLYDAVVPYPEIENLPVEPPRLIIDFAGSADLNTALHTRLAETLRGNIRIGGAHWDDSIPARDLPGPRPEFFFAPDHVKARLEDWGPKEFARRYGDAWLGFAKASGEYFSYDSRSGSKGALDVYNALIKGEFDPKSGFVIELD